MEVSGHVPRFLGSQGRPWHIADTGEIVLILCDVFGKAPSAR
jgi:hypothetical protein